MNHLAKDNALANCQELVEGNEDIIFVVFVPAVHIKLSDIVNTKLLLLQLDFVWVGRKFRSERSDVVRESGREEDDLKAFARKEA